MRELFAQQPVGNIAGLCCRGVWWLPVLSVTPRSSSGHASADAPQEIHETATGALGALAQLKHEGFSEHDFPHVDLGMNQSVSEFCRSSPSEESWWERESPHGMSSLLSVLPP